jgi:hypothetical protein
MTRISCSAARYYVDIAPAFAKVCERSIPACRQPGRGLKQIERTTKGTRNGPRAEMVLIDIYASFETVPPTPLRRASVQQRHPANDDVDFAMADVYSGASMEDYPQAAMA